MLAGNHQGIKSDKVNVMPHAVLPGDSILDYGAYVGSGVPVIQQARARLSAEWRATLLARDGAVITSVIAQIQQLPADASHPVISVGGNDAIRYRHIRSSPASALSVVLRELVSPAEPAETGGAKIAELLQKKFCAATIFHARRR